jgi:hypothetical protein
MAGRSKAKFLESLERGREASTQRARPAEKPVEEMTGDELDEQMRLAKVEVVEANRAVVAAAAEYTRPPTLAAKFRELQRGKRKTWR